VRSLQTTVAKCIFLGLLTGAFFFLKLDAVIVWWPLLQFVAGLSLGAGLLFFDKIILAPRYQDSEHSFVFTRSFLFLVAFACVSMWIITSSGSIIGNGLALGIASSLLAEMTHLRRDVAAFHTTFLAQVKKQYSQQDISRLVIVSWIYFLVLVGLVFRF